MQVKFVTVSPKLEIDAVPATFVDSSTIGTFFITSWSDGTRSGRMTCTGKLFASILPWLNVTCTFLQW